MLIQISSAAVIEVTAIANQTGEHPIHVMGAIFRAGFEIITRNTQALRVASDICRLPSDVLNQSLLLKVPVEPRIEHWRQAMGFDPVPSDTQSFEGVAALALDDFDDAGNEMANQKSLIWNFKNKKCWLRTDLINGNHTHWYLSSEAKDDANNKANTYSMEIKPNAQCPKHLAMH